RLHFQRALDELANVLRLPIAVSGENQAVVEFFLPGIRGKLFQRGYLNLEDAAVDIEEYMYGILERLYVFAFERQGEIKPAQVPNEENAVWARDCRPAVFLLWRGID